MKFKYDLHSKNVQRLKPLEIDVWCQILRSVRLTGNLEELKHCMIHSLQISCKEYEIYKIH